jgi:pyrroline-5-carboxylate reductase
MTTIFCIFALINSKLIFKIDFMKKINKLVICLAVALVGCNSQKQTTSPTLPEVSRWTGEYGGIDKSYDDQLFFFIKRNNP